MKKYFLGAAALLALTACSNDETVDLNQDGNVISFAVTANNPSRAATGQVFNPNALPSDFKVWAAYNKDTYKENYFSEALYTKQADGSYTCSQTHYWPNDGKVTFLALRNQSGTVKWTPTDGTNIAKIEGFTVQPTANATDGFSKAENQTDFIYALTSTNKTSAGATGQTTLNFRHALSQVVFKAQVTNPNLHVDIEGVTVCNAYGKADLTFPYANVTDDKFVDPNEATVPSGTFNQANWGNWYNDSRTKYTLTFSPVAVAKGDAVNLTDNAARHTDAYTLLLLPQETTPWNPNGGKLAGDAEQTGTYFLVKCRIRNVANPTSGVQPTDVYLWGATEAKDIAVPATFDWKQGKKYVITFEFGNGNGGYNPGDSKPVLVPISFTVTVDDFAKGDDQTVPMN